jgi:hypothetical protein
MPAYVSCAALRDENYLLVLEGRRRCCQYWSMPIHRRMQLCSLMKSVKIKNRRLTFAAAEIKSDV